MGRNARQFIIISRHDAGPISVVRCEVPATPQTLAIRVRPGQQVVVELEEDNTRAKRKPEVQP